MKAQVKREDDDALKRATINIIFICGSIDIFEMTASRDLMTDSNDPASDRDNMNNSQLS